MFLAFCVLIGFPEFITAILFYMGSFAPLLGPAPDMEQPGPSFGYYHFRCSSIASPLTLTVVLWTLFGFLFARRGTRPAHYGLTPARWPANLALGLLAFILATPIILGVHLAMTLAAPTRTSPVVEIFKRDVFAWEWLLLANSLVVAAPLLEEIVFRGILLGWLRRASLAGHLAIVMMTVGVAASAGVYFTDPQDKTTVFDLSPVLFASLLAVGYGFQLCRLARLFQLGEEEIQAWQPDPTEMRRSDEPSLDAWKEANANLAIYGSAMLFASFHSPAWPAPIPLFLMGLVLGALARRTQSLIGPIASLIALYGSVTASPAQNGNAQTTAERPSVVGSITNSVLGSQFPRRK